MKPKKVQVRCHATAWEHCWSSLKTVRQRLARPVIFTDGDAPYVKLRYR